jgi:hypothetical protein
MKKVTYSSYLGTMQEFEAFLRSYEPSDIIGNKVIADRTVITAFVWHQHKGDGFSIAQNILFKKQNGERIRTGSIALWATMFLDISRQYPFSNVTARGALIILDKVKELLRSTSEGQAYLNENGQLI